MEKGTTSRSQVGDGYQPRTLRLTRKLEQGKTFSEHTLVGKLITLKWMSCHVLKSVVVRLWNLKNELEVKELDGNVFMFSFENKNERCKVIEGEQWIVLGSLLIVKEWSPDILVEEVDLSKATFWVQVKGLAPDQLNEENAASIASMVGDLVETDFTLKNGVCLNNIMKIKVRLDVSEPLCDGFNDIDDH
ncbi:hypothetical protein Tsubulata_049132, partial [Turnera subulata]